MKNKIKLIALITGIVVIAVIALLLFGKIEKPECAEYVLDDAHKITDVSKIPQGTWDNMTSPDSGSKLERIVIDSDNPNIMDEPWRYAYYSRNENKFWIADMPGMFLGGWYGSFEGYPCTR